MMKAVYLTLLAFPLLAGDLTGFVDLRSGLRTQSDPLEDDVSLAETRLRLETQKFAGPFDFVLKADVLYDALDDNRDQVNLDSGSGWFDLRSASVGARPLDWMDVKVGRQVLTWGTGDLLFINDLFPKDWVSFFVGRDMEYLKAPSDAAWAGLYFGNWTLDLVWTPEFDPDRYLTGERISFYPFVYSEDNPLQADVPDESEFSLRLATTVDSIEYALYGYHGFWKSPGGFNAEGQAVFPRLRVAGASLLTPLGVGLFNLEAGYYDSADDASGGDPLIKNSETRFLVGYNRELARDFSLGLQAYVEWMMDHDAYAATLPEGQPEAEELRQVLTVRLTRLLMNQNLILSGFLFVSPNEKDGYFLGSAEYKWSDQLSGTLGANLFFGREDSTFFGQLQDNSNLYAALRWWL